MDESKVKRVPSHGYTGAVVEHRRLSGAHLARIMHPPSQRIETHGHDWPVLTIFRSGSYREHGDDGSIMFDGPSVVFQPAGAVHADEIGGEGLETLALTFDASWLSAAARLAAPVRTHWALGGAVSAAARRLAEVWLDGNSSEAALRRQTSAFVILAYGRGRVAPAPPPAWGKRVLAALDQGASTNALADSLARHPAWLARAYRSWRGEGIGETLRRRRVERATVRLRATSDALADVAAACGFCDQSHMNRAFRAVLGRTPLDVRCEAPLLAPLAPAIASAAAG